jgi:hypothetical protein
MRESLYICWDEPMRYFKNLKNESEQNDSLKPKVIGEFNL